MNFLFRVFKWIDNDHWIVSKIDYIYPSKNDKVITVNELSKLYILKNPDISELLNYKIKNSFMIYLQ